MNQLFMVMAVSHGLDAAIVNPLDLQMMTNITADEALMGEDPYCMNYIKAFREQRLNIL